MTEKNNCVLYGNHGICEIVGKETKDVYGNLIEYYVLRPVYESGSTVYVPVKSQSLVNGMRKILSKEEVLGIIEKIALYEPEWILNDGERYEKCKNILLQGDRLEIIKMIKCLYIHQQSLLKAKKKPRISDERFLKEAEKILYQEFAYVLDIDTDKVVAFISEICERIKNEE